MVTIRDVARKCGFSPSAVSFVLNDAALARYMAEESKKRIRQAAAELGYHPNQFARTLRSKRSRTIGVVVFDISDPYCTQILRGIENALYKSGWYLPLLADVQNDRARSGEWHAEFRYWRQRARGWDGCRAPVFPGPISSVSICKGEMEVHEEHCGFESWELLLESLQKPQTQKADLRYQVFLCSSFLTLLGSSPVPRRHGAG